VTVTGYVFLAAAASPFIYYLIAIYSSWRFFRRPPRTTFAGPASLPPVSILKPIRGSDPDAYENFASFCRQDYPNYELLFCVDGKQDPVVPLLDRLMREFPDRPIRVLYGSGRQAANDKVSKLARLVSEAEHEVLVINDSDVRARPDYLREIITPLCDARVGATTCLYVTTGEKTFSDRLQTVGMMSDFYAGVLVDWQLEGLKFALGPTIATTRSRLAAFGGYEAIENRPADDLLVGRFIAEQGYEVALLPYVVETVADFHSLSELTHKRLRWIVVMRHMRPWGHLGLLFTQGLAWSLAAIAVRPSTEVAFAYLGAYLALRFAMTWMIGVHGLGSFGLAKRSLWKTLPLIPVWDAMALAIWLASFTRRSIRWRGADYHIRDGLLVPVFPPQATE